MTTTDSDGNKLIAKGSSRVIKEHSYSELKQFQWNVNQPQGFGFQANRLLKFELRRPPTNDRIMDLVIEWEEQNPGGLDVEKLPTFWNCVEHLRIMINNKEVCDLKEIQGIKQEWFSRWIENHQHESTRDAHWHWCAGEATFDDPAIPEAIVTPVIPAGGGIRQFYASFKDIISHFCMLPLNNISLIEIEIQLTTNGTDIGSPLPEALGIVHNNIRVWSQHKVSVLPPPKQFANHTLWHREHEVLTIPIENTPFQLPVVGVQQYVVDLHTFFARRSLIQRIHVLGDNNVAGSFRFRPADWIGGLELLRNGDRFGATEFFYQNPRQIKRAADSFYKRHAGSVEIASNPLTAAARWGSVFPQTFIDTSTVSRGQNTLPGMEPHSVASEGIDNQTNLELRITNLPGAGLGANSSVVVIIEWLRFDRISPSGNVLRILNP
jgi:hypothetical protein